ncbi:MAG: DUF748 domain-containing protein [Bdellovibrio sp.]|nr:DUF748 domain-containing protein [Bdellovibrio sp.]
MKSKIAIGIVILLVAIRAVLPSIVLPKVNSYLKDFSEIYVFHIEDLDISILRGAYRFEGLTGQLRKQKENFIQAKYIDVSLSWREIFRGRILTDVVADSVKFVLTQELMAGSKKQPAAKTIGEGKKAKEKLFPFNASRIDIRNSDFLFADVSGLPPELQLKVTGLDGRLNNVTTSPEDPISLFVGKGSLMNSGLIKVVGELNRSQKPLDWNFDVEVKEFEATKLNSFLKRKGPLTFEQGSLDLYGEIKSENGKLEGYVKPFLKKATFIGDQNDFKSFKHFGIEITVAALNALLKSSKDKSVATKIIFSYTKDDFQWNASHAISTAIAHGFQDKVEPGLENLYSLNLKKPQEVVGD